MRVRRLLLAAVAVAVLVTGAWFARRDPSPSAAEQALGKVLPEVRFKRTPLDEALATLGRMAGTSIVLDRPTAEQAEYNPAKPVDLRLRNVTLDQALTHLLGYASSDNDDPLIHTLHGDSIVVTTAEGTGQYAYARVYDVRDIVVQAPESVGEKIDTNYCFGGGPERVEAMSRQDQDDELLTVMQEIILPADWDTNGGLGVSAHAMHGRLLVVTSWHGHRQIERFLDWLRHPIGTNGRQ